MNYVNVVVIPPHVTVLHMLVFHFLIKQNLLTLSYHVAFHFRLFQELCHEVASCLCLLNIVMSLTVTHPHGEFNAMKFSLCGLSSISNKFRILNLQTGVNVTGL